MTCKTICQTVYARVTKKYRGSPYAAGNKFCRICDGFVHVGFDVYFCPCCGYQLRNNGRKTAGKARRAGFRGYL